MVSPSQEWKCLRRHVYRQVYDELARMLQEHKVASVPWKSVVAEDIPLWLGKEKIHLHRD